MRIILVLVIMSCVSCDPTDDRLKIKNESKRFLFYDFSNQPQLRENSPFSGFMRIENNDTILTEDNPVIPPDSLVKVHIQGNWELYIKQSKADKLYITLFDGDVLKKYSWDHIRANNMFLHQYELSLDALNKLDWQIFYSDSLHQSKTTLDH